MDSAIRAGGAFVACMTARALAGALALAASVAVAHAQQPTTGPLASADVPLPAVIQSPPPDRPDWLTRVDVKPQTDAAGSSNLTVSSTQPLYVPDKTEAVFTQLHVDGNDQSANRFRVSDLGLGYRKLLRDDLMVGIGGFHDGDWTDDNQRTGAGAELKWQVLDLSANYYLCGDPWSLSNGTRPQPGSNMSLSSQLPFLPWVHASLGTSGVLAQREGRRGYTTSMHLDLLRNLELDIGARDMATDTEDHYARLRLTFGGAAPDPAQRDLADDGLVAATPFESRDLSGGLLQASATYGE